MTRGRCTCVSPVECWAGGPISLSVGLSPGSRDGAQGSARGECRDDLELALQRIYSGAPSSHLVALVVSLGAAQSLGLACLPPCLLEGLNPGGLRVPRAVFSHWCPCRLVLKPCGDFTRGALSLHCGDGCCSLDRGSSQLTLSTWRQGLGAGACCAMSPAGASAAAPGTGGRGGQGAPRLGVRAVGAPHCQGLPTPPVRELDARAFREAGRQRAHSGCLASPG